MLGSFQQYRSSDAVRCQLQLISFVESEAVAAKINIYVISDTLFVGVNQRKRTTSVSNMPRHPCRRSATGVYRRMMTHQGSRMTTTLPPRQIKLTAVNLSKALIRRMISIAIMRSDDLPLTGRFILLISSFRTLFDIYTFCCVMRYCPAADVLCHCLSDV